MELDNHQPSMKVMKSNQSRQPHIKLNYCSKSNQPPIELNWIKPQQGIYQKTLSKAEASQSTRPLRSRPCEDWCPNSSKQRTRSSDNSILGGQKLKKSKSKIKCCRKKPRDFLGFLVLNEKTMSVLFAFYVPILKTAIETPSLHGKKTPLRLLDTWKGSNTIDAKRDSWSDLWFICCQNHLLRVSRF